ncbi:MAG: hypothetical protein K8T26_13690 [Lentisphaerae bacterium]|nr:hypothetical protein [Lentisphaerota bacterium]
MRPVSVWLLAVVAATAVGMSAYGGTGETVGADVKAGPSQAAFVCPECKALALEAGECTHCAKTLTHVKVLATKDGNALVCECAADCTHCAAKSMQDGKCACGKDVSKVSAKGFYVCPDGCAEVSQVSGKCACGKDLVKLE